MPEVVSDLLYEQEDALLAPTSGHPRDFGFLELLVMIS
jgi:hypothetical protein